MQKDIERVIPNANSAGLAILDWEGKAMNLLNTLPLTDSRFNRILNEYEKMIKVAKSLRPKIKWGIYALPFRNYWSRNEEWKARCFMLIPLLKKCDLLTPSIYSFYSDSLYRNKNRSYVRDNVSLALHIGSELNKPVLPFVTHRWPNSVLIPKKEFIAQIDYIFKTQYLYRKVAGIIWWGPDEYYYNINDQQVRNEVRNSNVTFSSYFDDLVYDYLSLIVRLNSFKQ